MTARETTATPSFFMQRARLPKPISWKKFQEEYLSREDCYKYEWVNGRVEKTKRWSNEKLRVVPFNLIRLFNQLFLNGSVHGKLLDGNDRFFLKNQNRPEIIWLTDEQIKKMTDDKTHEVPNFVVEVISGNVKMNQVREKIINYRDVGVQVVWHIFPKMQQVDVYFGKKLSQSQVCLVDDICSAEPALPNFKISVNEIFRKN